MTQKNKILGALYALVVVLILSAIFWFTLTFRQFVIIEAIVLSVFAYSLTRIFRKSNQ